MQISFNPNDPADFARAFVEFAGQVAEAIEQLQVEVASLAEVIKTQAWVEDGCALQNVSLTGSRTDTLRGIAAQLQDKLAVIGGAPSDALARLVVENAPPPPKRSRLAVVGGTNTALAASSADVLHDVEVIAAPFGQTNPSIMDESPSSSS